MAKPNQWNVTTDGHRGDIVVHFVDVPPPPVPPPPLAPPVTVVPPGIYQVIFFRSVAVPANDGERHYITIENEGPSDMRVWVDSDFHPEAAGVLPQLVLAPGQSGSVSAARLALVRPASAPKVKGNYVFSWCCPTPPRAIGVTEPPVVPPHA